MQKLLFCNLDLLKSPNNNPDLTQKYIAFLNWVDTFNAVRNLLKYLGVNKIIFVSLGNFSRPFQKKDYIINGDVYKLGYTYQLVQSTQQNLTYNYAAKNEIDELYNIFNS